MAFFIPLTINAQDSNAKKKIYSIYQVLINKSNDKHRNEKLLGIIGKMNYPKKSKKIILKILDFSVHNNNPKQIVDSYYALSNYYYFNAKLDSALFAINKAGSYLKKDKFPLLESSIKLTKGGIFLEKGNIIAANHNYLSSLEVLERLDTSTLSMEKKKKWKGKKLVLFNSLANFNKSTDNYENANEYYTKAYKMAMSMNDKRVASILLSNQGDLLLNMKRFDDALDILKKSIDLKKEIRYSPQSIAITKLNIALVHSQINNNKKALQIFDSIIPLFLKANRQKNLMYSLTGRGQLFLKMKRYKNAIDDSEKAYQIATKIGNLEYQNLASECLSKSYFLVTNFKKAYYYQTKHSIFKDSIFNSNNVKKITQMQMQYEFDKQQELQEIEIKNKAVKNRLIIRNLLIGLLGLLLLLGLLYKLYYDRKRNNLVLAQKNIQINKALADNEVLLKETHHRVKNSLQMISSLLYLQSENIEDKKAAASVKDGQIRVKSMALIHQKLYQKDNLTGIEVSDYINDLAESIFQSHNIDNNTIKLLIDVDKMILDIDTVTPIGVIINELIINALKHAFSNKKDHALIQISLHNKGDVLLLKVEDNGKGFDMNRKKEKSFGLKLINSLSRKLKAELQITNKNGTVVELRIKRFTIK